MRTQSALHIRMLGSISKTFQQIMAENPDQAESLDFRQTYAFWQRLKPWNKAFLKPPMPLLRQCQLDALTDFYAARIDFTLFEDLPQAVQRRIHQEIGAHAARTAMDTYMGGRLRNLAQMGIQRPEWPRYQELVRDYYREVIPAKRQQIIRETQETLSGLSGEVARLAVRQAEGELFHDVDRLRLMSPRRFQTHMQELVEDSQRFRSQVVELDLPKAVADSLDWLGLPPTIGLESLKQRYRELALVYHPDKGGTRKDMQALNDAYRAIKHHLEGMETANSR